MSVLLTGGIGFIGSHIFVELVQDYDVIIVDNLSNSSYDQVKKLELLTKKEVNFYAIDMQNIKNLEKVFIDNKIIRIIHLAGLKAVNESIRDPLFYYSHNLEILLNLLKLMKKYDCKNLVFSSSATVYGSNNQNNALTEDSQIGFNLTNPYGKTKYFQEEILKDLYSSDNSYNITILRYFNPVGNDPSGVIGEEPTTIPSNLFPCILASIKNKTELKIYGNTYNTHDGSAVRDFIHVVDLAKAHVIVLNCKGFNIYNIGTGKKTSVLDIICAFENTNNIKLNYVIDKPREGDVARVYANCDKIYRELGWKAEKTVSDMCRDSYTFFIKQCASYT